MARLDQVHPQNAAGSWFVDTRCIDCDTCRQLDPAMFGRRDGQSVVTQQPAGPDAETWAWRAALACPTQSIGARHRPPRPSRLFPMELADGVHYCGFNSEDSYGANAFFVVRPDGNLLVDSPRFTRQLADPIAELGGISDVLLTHRDDVADADRWADRFGARVWIHRDDCTAAPFATDVVDGDEPVEIRPGLLCIPVPGHTRGSVLFLLEERFLFTGDSLHWDVETDDLQAFRGATWFSWEAQTRSLGRFARSGHRFEWVLAGHGGRARRPAEEMHERLDRLVERMGRSR